MSVPVHFCIFVFHNHDNMLKFICLGSGSSGNSYFLFTADYGILIDAGIGIRNLRRLFHTNGLSLDQINAVFITHDHADHIKAVGNLANDYHLPVYATPLVHEGINRNYCVTSKLTPRNTYYIHKGESTELSNFIITPFEIPHDSSDNVGYSIQVNGVNFCLITDIGHITPEVEQYVSRANYLVLEANHDEDMLMMGPYPAYLKGRIRGDNGHLCNKDAGKLLAENMTENMRHVWLCHLSEENNHPELARKTVDSILHAHGIITGKDFQLDVLKRKTPSALYDLL